MTHTIHEQGNEGWTVNNKRRRGELKDEKYTETEATFRKFGINLGSFRTEVDIPKIYLGEHNNTAILNSQIAVAYDEMYF